MTDRPAAPGPMPGAGLSGAPGAAGAALPGLGRERAALRARVPSSLEEIKRRLAHIEEHGRERPTAEVTTARPLTDRQRAVFEARLRQTYGSDLHVQFRVEPAILGGVVVRVGDRLLDDSLATRLAQLRELLVGARVRQHIPGTEEDPMIATGGPRS